MSAIYLSAHTPDHIMERQVVCWGGKPIDLSKLDLLDPAAVAALLQAIHEARVNVHP